MPVKISNCGITADKARELFVYEPDTGRLRWAVSRGHVSVGTDAGVRRDGYAMVSVNRRGYLVHRLAWLIYYGHWPEGQLDHIDRDRNNNRIANLRLSDHFKNSHNQSKAHANNKLGILGVSLVKGSYRAGIEAYGTRYHLGTYATPEEAHEAYVKAKRELHPGNTL